MTDWQPIETAPKDGTKIDGWDRGGYRTTNISWRCHNWLNGKPQSPPSWGRGDRDGPAPDPTHWMPLPEPPK